MRECFFVNFLCLVYLYRGVITVEEHPCAITLITYAHALKLLQYYSRARVAKRLSVLNTRAQQLRERHSFLCTWYLQNTLFQNLYCTQFFIYFWFIKLISSIYEASLDCKWIIWLLMVVARRVEFYMHDVRICEHCRWCSKPVCRIDDRVSTFENTVFWNNYGDYL